MAGGGGDYLEGHVPQYYWNQHHLLYHQVIECDYMDIIFEIFWGLVSGHRTIHESFEQRKVQNL
jgi:hypothetical protein